MNFSKIVFYSFIGIFVASIVYAGFHSINAPDDIFWHVRMGGDFLHQGFKAFSDQYSFTMPGQPVKISSLLFDVVSFGFFDQLGYPGLQALRVVLWLATLLCLLLVMRNYKYDTHLQLIAAGFVTFAILERYQIRPELAGFPFLVAISFYYERSLERFSLRSVLILSLLFFAWTCVHLSAAAAYPFIAAYLFNWLISLLRNKRFDRREIGNYALSVLVFIGIGYLPLIHQHVILMATDLDINWSRIINELRPTDFNYLSETARIYTALLFPTTLLLIRKRNFGSLALVILFVLQAHANRRFVSYAIVATLPMTLDTIQSSLSYLQSMVKIEKIYRSAAQFLLTWILPVVPFLGIAEVLVSAPMGAGLDGKYFPLKIVKEFQDRNWRGNMMADFPLSSYLILPLGDQLKFYLDGRLNILYPIDLAFRFYRDVNDKQSLNEDSEKYRIDYVLTNRTYDAFPLDTTAMETKLFSVSRFDGNYLLLSRLDHSFENLTQISIHPEYLASVPEDILRKELSDAEASWDKPARRSFLVDLLSAYLDRDRNQSVSQFLKDNGDLVKLSAENLRFGGYLAEQGGIPELALLLYGRIPKPLRADQFKMIELALNLKQYNIARSMLKEIPEGRLDSQDSKRRQDLENHLSELAK